MNPAPGGRRIHCDDFGEVTAVRFTQPVVLDDAVVQSAGDDLFRLVDELGRRKILFDFGNLEFVTSAILGKFITLYRKLKMTGGRLVLCRLNRDLLDIFRVVKLDRIFCIAQNPPFATVEAVIAEFFGNPHRTATCAPEWRTDTVLALARRAYDAREFEVLPILADALQDAGCDNEDVLNHCRDANATHARGCWVCDLVLERA
jgi:anti-sigma B factor antagonist